MTLQQENARLKATLCMLTDMYDEPGFLLVNYTIRRALRDLLGRELSRQTIDREPCHRSKSYQDLSKQVRHYRKEFGIDG
jgi:hypothetical protein